LGVITIMEKIDAKRYTAVVHVRWELPFPLMLPEEAFLCWEPGEGTGLFDPSGQIGTLLWKRSCGFLSAETVFGTTPRQQHHESFPIHDYRQDCVLSDGKHVTTAEMYRGPDGGFAEARPFTVANVFLCISFPGSYRDEAITDRACAALNNLIDIYRFIMMDPMVRPIENKKDHYCTVISEAYVPEFLQHLSPDELLLRIDRLRFGSIIGKNRLYIVGGNTLTDLAGNKPTQDGLTIYYRFVREEHRLELFHQLIFSAIRRLKRKEGALAVVDAQSAFEIAVAGMLKDGLTATGVTEKEIHTALEYGGRLHLLQRRLRELDNLALKYAATTGGHCNPFLDSDSERKWRECLYDLRNEIVHGGRRTTTFDETKRAIVAGLKAVNYLHGMCPHFERSFMWVGEALELQHLSESAGRLFRLFES
jgi:hypothetical protein